MYELPVCVMDKRGFMKETEMLRSAQYRTAAQETDFSPLRP
jgi:hypothetical protein